MHSIIHRAIERHGGIECYRGVKAIELSVRELGGMIPRFKGLGRTHYAPKRATFYPHQKNAIFHEYGDDGCDVLYQGGDILCSDKNMTDYRRSFDGFRKIRRWSPFDAAYFFGYALTDYLSFPFSLENREVVSFSERPNGESRITLRFPGGSDTHCRRQTFWFDSSGLLVRHDYRADILGPMFFGAHHSFDYRSDLPFPIAERRLVRMRFGRSSTPIPVLRASFQVEDVIPS